MSNQFLKLRRSAVPGKIPDTGSLDLGEIALNTYDGLAFMKKSVGGTESIVVIGNSTGSFTGSFTGEFTGSLLGTASWAYNAVTASTADDFYIRGNVTGSNALFSGTVTAQRLVVQTISSSVIYSSGSNIFGDELTDTQQFTGSVTITGSLSLNNDPVVTLTPYNTFSSSIQLRATNLETTASVLTTASASFAIVSSSYASASGSLSIRVTDLETTASVLTVASASFAVVSASYASASGSLSTRVTTLENASASFAQDSGSNSIRLTNLESTASILTQASASFSSSIALLSGSFTSFSSSYLIDSASWNNNISLLSQSFLQTSQSLSASIQLLSGSFLAFSQSYNTASFTGSFVGQAV